MNHLSDSRPLDRTDRILAAGAFALAVSRAWSLPVVTDGTFHLARGGVSLLRASLAAWTAPPGGEGASLLGSLFVGLGAVFPTESATLGRVPGSVLAGFATALVYGLARRRAERPAALLAVALLVLPPWFLSSFVARPDVGLGGVLVLASLATRRAAPAWAGALSTPLCLPAAILSGLRGRESGPMRFGAPAAVAAVVSLAALALPAGSRAEILRSFFTGWGAPDLPSTLDAIREVWGGGVLLLAPFAVPWVARTRAGGAARPVWLATLATAFVFSPEGSFRAATPVLAPLACLVLAREVAAIPDRRAEPGSPSRPILFVLIVPIALFILMTGSERRWRRGEQAACARHAQIGAVLGDLLDSRVPVRSERTGAISFFSAEPIARLGASPEKGAVTVFGRGLVPETERGRRLFTRSDFVSRHAPLFFRRGPDASSSPDVIWIPRTEPTAAAPAGYAAALLRGFELTKAGDHRAAIDALRDAAGSDANGPGLAHEWLGILLELTGGPDEAELAFREARRRDPATARARGHLIDRELAQDRLATADTLLAEAFAFTSQDAKLWGTRARLNWLAGYPDEALAASQHAVTLSPRDARLVANHGSILWGTGDRESARSVWQSAVRLNPTILRFLGDFEGAPDDAPAPPLLPLYSGRFPEGVLRGPGHRGR